jgi:hypothetical protein
MTGVLLRINEENPYDYDKSLHAIKNYSLELISQFNKIYNRQGVFKGYVDASPGHTKLY